MNAQLIKAFRFFFRESGYVVGQGAVGALQLARAERVAKDLLEPSVSFVWEEDEPTEVWTAKGQEYTTEPAVYCLLQMNGRTLASLGGITESPDSRIRHEYRRVIEAELALEAFGSEFGL